MLCNHCPCTRVNHPELLFQAPPGSGVVRPRLPFGPVLSRAVTLPVRIRRWANALQEHELELTLHQLHLRANIHVGGVLTRCWPIDSRGVHNIASQAAPRRDSARNSRVHSREQWRCPADCSAERANAGVTAQSPLRVPSVSTTAESACGRRVTAGRRPRGERSSEHHGSGGPRNGRPAQLIFHLSRPRHWSCRLQSRPSSQLSKASSLQTRSSTPRSTSSRSRRSSPPSQRSHPPRWPPVLRHASAAYG
jgi:hypothetical protein